MSEERKELPRESETVTCSFRSPDIVAHLPSQRCPVEYPHPISDCGEFDHPTPARSEAAGGEESIDDASWALYIQFLGNDADALAREGYTGEARRIRAVCRFLPSLLAARQQLAAAREDAAEARRLVAEMCAETKHERIGKFGVLEKHIEALAVWHGATEPATPTQPQRAEGEDHG